MLYRKINTVKSYLRTP